LSPLNLQVYRRKTAGSSAGDPSIDPANWQRAFNEAFSAVDVLTISADLALTAVIRNVLRVASTVKNSSIKLPSANSLSNTNGTYLIKNTGALPLPVRDNAGTLLAVLPGGGASGIFACEDFSTAAGTWLVIAPENMAAIATGAATVWALASCSWCYISSIPGAADKALVAWISGGAMYAAIATRSGSGAVSIGCGQYWQLRQSARRNVRSDVFGGCLRYAPIQRRYLADARRVDAQYCEQYGGGCLYQGHLRNLWLACNVGRSAAAGARCDACSMDLWYRQ
jgi:hypothetical protein